MAERKQNKTAADRKRTSPRSRKNRPASKNLTKNSREKEVSRQKLLLGAAVLAVFLILCLVLKPLIFPVNKGTLVGVNEDVLSYKKDVEAACREYGISEYSTLMMAIMQQESSGQGTDVFQCSESPFNTEYENYPGAIQAPSYSIRVGAETFAYCLKQAKCRSIRSMDRVKLAIQEYNFGNHYAGWALENYGGYSEENAAEYSYMMQSELGWDSYGDPQYVAHVLQYYSR